MDKKEIEEFIESYENKTKRLIEEKKEGLDNRIQALKDDSEEKKKEMESAMKDFDDAFQKEMDRLDVERKRLIEISKAKADGLEGSISSKTEDCKLRLKNEYRKVREDLLNR